VREYWLSRGPRMFATMLVFLLFGFAMQEAFKHHTTADRCASAQPQAH